MTEAPPRRVALVHDWLVAQRGGENVLVELLREFPSAEIFTLVHSPGAVSPELEARPIHTSFIQKLSHRHFRPLLPLFPRAIESFDLSAFDVVISTSHCVAHGVLTESHQLHLAYVHTPMRYVYDQLPHYVPGGWLRPLAVPIAHFVANPLRRWDERAAQRADLLVANSQFVANRIARVWGRKAEVIHPPVDVEFFAGGTPLSRDGLLVVSALVPYKRVELAVQLCTAERLPLDVIGVGPQRSRLEAIAGPTVRFLGAQTPEQLRRAYRRAEALLFCGEEDFGIVPLEAIAAGCPVVALGRGGALETVRGEGPRPTGVLFEEPTLEALHHAVRSARHMGRMGAFESTWMVDAAREFSPSVFRRKISRLVPSLPASFP